MKNKKKILFFGGLSRSIRNSRLEIIDQLRKNYDLIIYLRTKDEITENIIKRKKINFYKNTFSKNKFSTNLIIDFIFLIKIVISDRPQIIFSYNTIPNIVNLFLNFLFPKAKSIFLITGLGNFYSNENNLFNFKFFLFKFLIKKIINRSTFIIFQNKEDKFFFKKINNNKFFKNLIVNGSGVNIQKYYTKYKKIRKPYILMISRIFEKKGVNEFLDASKKIKKKFPNYKFTLVGKKENDKLLNKKIKFYQSKKIINYIEFRENIKFIIKKASVVVLPTYYREGVPRVLIEAMSMYKPIITTKTPGCKDTLIDGVNGYFVKSKSSNDLVEKILKISSNKAKWKKMGDASRKLVKKRFDANKIANKIAKYLNDNI